MCPWKDLRRRKRESGSMTPSVWTALQPHLDQVEFIDFSGGGEPLLQPRLAEWIREAESHGCNTGFLTNGMLLDRRTAEELIGIGIDWIGVSLDGATGEIYEQIRIGADFETVCANISGVASIRREKTPFLMINFLLLPMNMHQAEDIVSLAGKLGVDQVNFKQCDITRGELAKGLGLFGAEMTREIRRYKKALSRAVRLARKMKIRTTAFSFNPDEMPVCLQDPRDSLFVRYDGAVSPCINLAYSGPTTFMGKDVVMPELVYGRAPETDLAEIWESEASVDFRRKLEQRARLHDAGLFEKLTDSSWPQIGKILQSAKDAMPPAPEGCSVCHYLYDI